MFFKDVQPLENRQFSHDIAILDTFGHLGWWLLQPSLPRLAFFPLILFVLLI